MVNHTSADDCPELHDTQTNNHSKYGRSSKSYRMDMLLDLIEFHPSCSVLGQPSIDLHLTVLKSVGIKQNTGRMERVSLYMGKGCPIKCGNYRLILLLSTSGKVFDHVLLCRIWLPLNKPCCPQHSSFTTRKLGAVLSLWLLTELHRVINAHFTWHI